MCTRLVWIYFAVSNEYMACFSIFCCMWPSGENRMGTLRMRQLGIVCLFCLGLGMPQFQNRERSSGTGEMVPGKLIEDMINIVSQPLEIILLCCPFSWRILFCTSLRELGLFIVFSYRSTEQSLNLKWISSLFSIVLSLLWCCLKWQMKVQHLKPCSLFFNIKMHSIKSRFVIGQQNTLFTGLCAQSLAQEFYKLELWRGLPVENYSWKQVTSKVKFDCDYLRERGLNWMLMLGCWSLQNQ